MALFDFQRKSGTRNGKSKIAVKKGWRMNRGVSVLFLSVVFLAAALPARVGEVSAQQPVDIKITTIQLRQQQMGVGIERLAKHIKERLGDKVRVRTYPAAQLYGFMEDIQATIKGEVEMAYVIGSALEPIDGTQELWKLPFLFPNVDVMYKVLDGPLGKKLFSRLDQKGLAVLGVVSSGNVLIHNNKRPIKNPDDFKGLKMRSFGPMGAATLKTLGAIAVVSVPEEMYTAFQQGMIDGGANPNIVFLARKLYDVQKYVTDAGMLNATLAVLLANKAWWDKLPPDVRSGLSESIQRLVKEQRAEVEVENETILKQLTAKGCQVYPLPSAEQAAWKKTLQPVYTEFAPKIGSDVVREVQQEVERLSKTKK
jgi:C4-dicarboxylate-binding protein DctP